MNITTIIPTIDNGKSKVTVFDINGMVVEHRYNYGKGYGFLFLTKYPTLESYKENRMSSLGSQLIYSSSNNNDCTQEGREIEFAISKLI